MQSQDSKDSRGSEFRVQGNTKALSCCLGLENAAQGGTWGWWRWHVLDYLGSLRCAGSLMLTLRSMKKSKARDRMNLTCGKDAWWSEQCCWNVWDSEDACWRIANTYCPQLRCEIKTNSSFHKLLYPASKKAVAKQQLRAKSFANAYFKEICLQYGGSLWTEILIVLGFKMWATTHDFYSFLYILCFMINITMYTF